MSQDTELRDQNDNVWSLDNLSTSRWLEGHKPGAEAVVAWLMERATKCFVEGKDEEAVMLRSLVPLIQKEVVPRLVANAERHEREHPSVRTDAQKRAT